MDTTAAHATAKRNHHIHQPNKVQNKSIAIKHPKAPINPPSSLHASALECARQNRLPSEEDATARQPVCKNI